MKPFLHRSCFLKRAGILFLFAVMFLLPACSCALAENLLINGGFETMDEDGLPEGWYTYAYYQDEGYTVFGVSEDASSPGGGLVAWIDNIEYNDARFEQDVAVSPETLYRFSGYIRADQIDQGLGANLSVEGLYVFSESVFDTDGEWKYVEWYGETGTDQTEVTLFARVGGYSGESCGKAWFDDLCLEEVDEVPGDAAAALWYRKSSSKRQYDDTQDEEEEGNTRSAFWPALILIAAVYVIAAVILLQKLSQDPSQKLVSVHSGYRWVVLAGLAGSVVLHLLVCYFSPGYSVDVNCFTSWGSTMASVGAPNFYQSTGFCDYPPAYLYILDLNHLTGRLFSDPGAVRIAFRLLPSLCNVAGAFLLFLYGERKFHHLSPNHLAAFVLLFAFNPSLILNSSAWGQIDSVLCLSLMMVALLAVEGRWEGALPCYMLSVLIKPQALMLGPLGLAVIIIAWIQKKDYSRVRILIGAALSIVVLAAVVIPFTLNLVKPAAENDLIGAIAYPYGESAGAPSYFSAVYDWIVNLYSSTLSSYPYTTINTANIHYLLGSNWGHLDTSSNTVIPLVMGLSCLAYGVYWYFRIGRDQKKPWIELLICGVFLDFFLICSFKGLDWTWVGIASMAFPFVIVLSLQIRKKDIRLLPYLGALLYILLYVFGIKMHERYIFPALFLLACAYIINRDKRIVWILLILTGTVLLNEGIILDNNLRFPTENKGHLNADTKSLADFIAMLNLCAAYYGIWLAVEMCSERKPLPVLKLKNTGYAKDNRLHWHLQDTLILTLILIIYSGVCFSTLGSTKAPQTAWVSTARQESVTLDLGEKKEDFHVLYFCRVSRNNFSVAVSDDGVQWSDEAWAEMKQGQCWKWKYVCKSWMGSDGQPVFNTALNTDSIRLFSGRYVRITAQQIGLNLCEVLIRDQKGNILPTQVYAHENENTDSPLAGRSMPGYLIDEQDTMEGLPQFLASEKENIAQPSWWNSTYFDEIYHPRTAYEFTQGTSPYETTHPPLGKVLMSWGVSIFGMTPFGWRFAGALAGVAMLAAVYLVTKQLVSKTTPAAMACGLMALDTMHLTQTQIGTIDSFPVLFILLSFFFMLRFIQTDLRKGSFLRILADLGLSGLSFGLAVSSKWIGIYAGIGLAVLFFWHCGRNLLRKDGSKGRVIPRLMIIIPACVVFFIVVPLLIYLLSYLPYFAYKMDSFQNLSDYLNAVWDAQVGMFNYHSTPGLGMDHPFYSPWYEWPVSAKPMYYDMDQYLSVTQSGFSIFCFGNLRIWIPALFTLFFCLWQWISCFCRRRSDLMSVEYGTPLTSCFFVLIGILAQYLPWMLVPRGTYIYHYFASTPFLYLSIALFVHYLYLRNKTVGRVFAGVFLYLALTWFIVMFPYASGLPVSMNWLELGKKFAKVWY